MPENKRITLAAELVNAARERLTLSDLESIAMLAGASVCEVFSAYAHKRVA